MKQLNRTRIAAAVALAASIGLAGCGGSSSSSDDDSAEVFSRGVITGFGSIHVNGRKFETDDAVFEVDDDEGVEGDLRVGMIVTVMGSSDDGGDYAEKVIYDNELKGPVSAIDIIDGSSKTLTILGRDVLVTADKTTIDDDGGLNYGTIAIGDVLEVSGYEGELRLIATHIELQDDDDEIEIKGTIENLVGNTFEVHGFPVSFDGNTEIDDDIDSLENGLYVEVEGELNGAGDTLLALEIEAEDYGLDDDADDVEIEGVISAYDMDTDTFTILGLKVDASDAELEPADLVLDDELFVEVEGYIADGILFAEEIELEDDDDDDS